jgi:DNA excision repair protein ERCC-6
LFGNTSDEEPEPLDEEDQDFLVNDSLIGVEESIIVDTDPIEEQLPVTSRPTADNDEKIEWDPMTPFLPPKHDTPSSESASLGADNNSNGESAFDVFLRVSALNKLIEEIIIPQSMTYSEQSGVQFHTTLDEIKAFLGITILMGYHKLPCMRDYWSGDSDLYVPFVTEVMTRDRYELIRKMLHFNNNEEDMDSNDRAFKVRHLVKHFNDAFHESRNQSRSQSIDEHMVRFKGHNMMKQYMKSKPIRWGFKLWVRACSKTGYVYEFDIYTGRKAQETEFGLGESVVLQLTEKIVDSGIIVAFDNFFTSPALMNKLHDRGLRAVGTVRTNRKNLPPLKKDQQMERGDVSGNVSSTGKISVCQWKDKRVVSLMSNFLDPYEMTTRRQKQKGSGDRAVIDVPVMVRMYNFYMGGVDLADQLKEAYEIDVRARYKYYLRLFFDMLDMAMCNSYIAFKDCARESKLSSKEFRQVVVRALTASFSSRKRSSSETLGSKKGRLDVRPVCQHLPIHSSERGRCHHCSTRKTNFRSNIKCSVCNVHLCLNSERNCYYRFHE